MLSLPHLPPRDDLWTSSPFRPLSHSQHQTDVSPNQANHNQQAHAHHHAHHGHATAPNQGLRSTTLASQQQHHRITLNTLTTDENLIEQRKQNVRRFGAHWLRPPGVPKTFQARLDEEVERREQLEMQRREAQMAELTAAEEAQRQQQALAEQARAQEQEAADGVQERDLDAEIPDADAVEDMDEDEDEDGQEEVGDEDQEEEDSEAEVTGRFNEDSLLEGSIVGGDGLEPGQTQSFLDAEDAELDGRAQDMRDLGHERDLDEDIPEAGSYEHTDTEAEDETDEDEDDGNEEMMNSSFSLPGSRRRSRRDRTSRASEMDLSRDDLEEGQPVAGSASYANPWLSRRMGDRQNQ